MKHHLLVLLFFFSLFGYSQNNNYTQKWQVIDSLEVNKQITSAIDLVDAIIQRSERKNDHVNYLKAKIYRWKFLQITQENSTDLIVKELNKTIADFPQPYKSIAQTYKAKWLFDFYKNNRYKISGRTQVDDDVIEDIELWDVPYFLREIRATFDLALSQKKMLQKYPVDDYDELLDAASLGRKFRPTLYDLIIHEALDFYDNDFYYVTRPENLFVLDDPDLFGDSKTFTSLKFKTIDSIYSKLNVLKTYQELEQNYQSKDEQILVYNELERLKFVYQNYKDDTDDKWDLYRRALENLRSKLHNRPASAMVLNELARSYYSLSDKKLESEDYESSDYGQEEIDRLSEIEYGKYLLKYPDYRKKAEEIAEIIINEFPDTQYDQEASSILAMINDVQLSLKTQERLSENQKGRIYIEYKNIDSLQLSIYKITNDAERLLNPVSITDSTLQTILKRKPNVTHTYLLPKNEDLNMHSVEFMYDGLPLGEYFLFASGPKLWSKDKFSFSKIRVTNLDAAVVEHQGYENFYVVDSKTGEPQKDVEVSIFKYAGDNTPYFKGYTFSNGEIPVPKFNSFSRARNVKFKNGEDTNVLSFYAGRKYYDEEKEDEIETDSVARGVVYLDRAIYRPGQTVYFKGILLLKLGKETSVVPNEYVTIFVDDANGNEIQEIRLKTNDYGSVSGEFTLPTSGPTGEFDIYLDEDYEVDSTFWDTVWDFDYKETTFSVEEYKRPTFEVNFDEITATYSPGDSVTITGKAESLMGANLSDVPVAYSINRDKYEGLWRYNATEKSNIKNDTIFTNNEGKFEIKFATVDSISSQYGYYNYRINASVTDVSGETREASTNFNIGKNNLSVKLTNPLLVRTDEKLNLEIRSTNLNNQPTKASGTLKIFKKKSPARVTNSRLWPAPEIQMIDEQAFAKNFPSEPYFNEGQSENWENGKEVFTTDFEIDGKLIKEIAVDKSWASGKYAIEVELNTMGGAFAEAKKEFTLINPKENTLPDHQTFAMNVLTKDPEPGKDLKLELLSAYDTLNLNLKVFDANDIAYEENVRLEGKEIVNITLPQTKEDRLKIQVYGLKDGQWITDQTFVNFPKEDERYLTIATRTFRNKLQPGLDEQWSFVIKDDAGKTPNAEILASMYDASLDQFVTENWERKIDFDEDYYYGPDFPNLNSEQISSIYFRKNFSARTNAVSRIFQKFDKLYDFGFDFGNPDSYQYRNYLSKIEKKQKLTVTGNTRGIVTDANGLPLPGVTVMIKGTSVGTTTNFDGQYGLNTSKGDVLIFSYVGFKQIESQANQANNMYIKIKEDSASLDEVVVMGYGKQKKISLTGAVATVSVENSALTSILEGRVAGVSIEMNDDEGSPGLASNIIIRGSASLTAKEQPLVIIDGVPTELSALDIDASQISSMQILKDASATAIYGSRAANGVLIITTNAALEEVASLETRKNLNETAFFLPHITANKDGEFNINFTSPESLTRWKLRLLAYDKSWTTGYLENTVITQKELSIQPNMPRFFRENDKITLKAKVTNLTDDAISGVAQLQLYNAITMQRIDQELSNNNPNVNFNIAQKNNASVSWKISIPENVEAITYKVLAKAGNFSDGEESSIPVLKNRMLVTESIPLFVRAGETENYEFSNLKNNTSSTLTNHKITLEYTSNPVWYAIKSLPYLMEFPYECAEQTFARFYANSIAAHIMNSKPEIKDVFESWKQNGITKSNLETNEELKSTLLAETPWVRDAMTEEEKQQRLGELFDLARLSQAKSDIKAKLQEQQLDNGAFSWFSGGRPNKFITRHILAGLGHMNQLGLNVKMNKIENSAIKYLDKDVLSAYKNHLNSDRKEEEFYTSPALMHYLYARSFFLDRRPFNEEIQNIANNVLEFQKDKWNTNTNYNNAILALVANRMGDKAFAKSILTGLKESAVVSEENGMYWKIGENSWWWYQSPIETHALIIEAFAEATNEKEVLEELKIWLLQNKRINSWETTKATTEAIYALLLQGEDWLTTTDDTTIKIGSETIDTKKLAATDKQAGTGYIKIDWDKNEVDTNMASISVKNKNEHAGYGGVYWQYFEDLDKIKSDNAGSFSIDKKVYLTKNSSTGKKLEEIKSEESIKIGDLVTIRMTVKSNTDMEFIHIKDMRASGFEPTDVISEHKFQDGTSYYQSTRDVATHFFFDSLKKGTYVLEYTMRANNAGTFSNGITTIENMYAPEFSSHTKGIRLEIKE